MREHPPAKTIVLAGRSCSLSGDPDDPYFQNLQEIAADLAPLEAWIRKNLPADAVVIDAGGNIGVTALLMSTLLPQGHVHVFEALPANADYLRHNLDTNVIRNCTVNAAALGSRSGTIAMQGAGSSSHVSLEAGSGGAVPGAIPMLTLDDYAATAGLDRLDFMKMDVEGYEPAVLEGGRATIERFAAPVFMEFNTWCLAFIHSHDAREFAHRLWDAFEVLSVDQSGMECPAGGGSADRFLHDNVVLHGTVEDVLLRLKPGAGVPRTGAAVPRHEDRTAGSVPDQAAMTELERLRAELDAIQRSMSWKLTTPLRTLGRCVRLLRNRR